LVFGAPDDLTPREIVQIAQKAGLDAHDAAAIQNVARVDRARRAWLETRPPRVYDGVGPIYRERTTFARAALGMRLFGPAGTSDAQALQALVAPSVRGRAMPSGVDVAAWLGSMEARVVPLPQEGVSRAAYDTTLENLVRARPPEDEWHASVYASGLAAIHTYLTPSLADGAILASTTSAWRRHKIESALGAWTMLRHDDVPFTRLGAPAAAPAPSSPRARGAIAFVEPHPEAIAQVVAMIEQAARGLAAIGAIDTPPKDSVYSEAEAILRTCLEAALHEANDQAVPSAALDLLPDRLAALEQRLGTSRAGELPIAIDVHADLAAGTVLEEAIGGADDMYLVLREPLSGRLVLAVGAAIAHYEFTQPAALLLTDEAWRARLAKSPPPRHAFTSAYLESPR
jgi:hypothetical protein